MDRLANGEATLMVQAVDADWARIVIQGDGVEGFVALRYLSAEAPMGAVRPGGIDDRTFDPDHRMLLGHRA